MDQLLRKHIDLVKDVVLVLRECAALLNGFDGQDDSQVFAISLHASAVQLYANCIALAETGEPQGIPFILRSIYECVVDLHNLKQDPGYARYMNAANAVQMRKLLKASLDGNPLFQGFEKQHDVAAELRYFEGQLTELAAAGIRKIDIKERCKRVGRVHEYESIFGLFCLDSHNNIAALFDRHVQHDQGIRISIFGEPHWPSVRRRLSFATGFVLQSAQMVHEAFGTGAAERMEPLGQRLEALRRETTRADQA